MYKYVCSVCGYAHIGMDLPECCPVCKVGPEKFEMTGSCKKESNIYFAGLNSEEQNKLKREILNNLIEELKAQYKFECMEVGRYTTMAIQAREEGFDEIADEFMKIAGAECAHATSFMKLINKLSFSDTENNLKIKIDDEDYSVEKKVKLAKLASKMGFHDMNAEILLMVKEEARNKVLFKNLLEDYFGLSRNTFI